jgi:CysZ protein
MLLDVLTALGRSAVTLTRPRVWLYVAMPAAIAFGMWVLFAMWELQAAVDWLIAQPPLAWLAAVALWLAKFFAFSIVWLGILSLTYLTALLITAIFFLPLIIEHLARRDYPDVVRMGEDSFVRSTTNSVGAAMLFIAGWLLTLPLWLIPGMGLLLPVFWLAWINRRTFAFDALAVHATRWESATLRKEHGLALLLLGVLLALLAHVPLLGLVVPPLAAIAYVHYSLEALRQFRGGEVVVMTGGEGS